MDLFIKPQKNNPLLDELEVAQQNVFHSALDLVSHFGRRKSLLSPYVVSYTKPPFKIYVWTRRNPEKAKIVHITIKDARELVIRKMFQLGTLQKYSIHEHRILPKVHFKLNGELNPLEDRQRIEAYIKLVNILEISKQDR